MIKNYMELDGDGTWLPEGWHKIKKYTHENGVFTPRNGITGIRWEGCKGEIEKFYDTHVVSKVSDDRLFVAVIETRLERKDTLTVYSEGGDEYFQIVVPKVGENSLKELSKFYSLEMPNGDTWTVCFSDGHDEYQGDIFIEDYGNVEVKNIVKVRF